MDFCLKIQPEWDRTADTVSAFQITWESDQKTEAGGVLAARILEIVKIPFCPLETLRFSDDNGEIEYSARDGEAEMGFIYRQRYISDRETQGKLRCSYRILPRVQPEGYRSSPYFDLVAEKGGVNGAGATFLIHPENLEQKLSSTLTWDLSLLPDGCRGIWSYSAEKSITKEISVMELLFTFYAVGKVHAVEEGTVGFYWFDEMPIDAEGTAKNITKMFLYLSKKFQDKGGDYRVFARRNHFPGGGGTAAQRSYLFGYGTQDGLTAEELQPLLAHEMVHNWPSLSDDPPGAGTWYVEGSAEYYSVMVQLEMGIAPLSALAEEINEKAATYYENPYIHLDNISLGRLYWEDRAAQRLPYARGIIYLSNLDAQIRRATNGEKSLLDIELVLLNESQPDYKDFLRIGSEIAGFDLTPDFENMSNGGELVPDPDGFGGYFNVEPCRVKVNKASHRGDVELTGEERDGYRWSVRG
ncbi:MAG: hypothetical protein LUI87_11960 [Lachnospiraceae bacterium]|nr:hypothetical protein [Lachnospiraceae bacterium]